MLITIIRFFIRQFDLFSNLKILCKCSCCAFHAIPLTNRSGHLVTNLLIQKLFQRGLILFIKLYKLMS